MLALKSTDRICICGLPGTGKTVFCRWIASEIDALRRLGEPPNILIIDPLNQYQQFPDECRYIPRQETPQELESICRRLYSRSNMTLIIEEAEQYLSQNRPILPYTSGLIRMGRNWGIGVVAVTRRIQDINKRFFDLAQHVFFFRCGFKSRDYIADMLGAEFVRPVANPRVNTTGYTITTLPPYHTLHFNLETEMAEIVTLKLGAREHIEEITKKPDGRKKEEKTEEEQQLWRPRR